MRPWLSAAEVERADAALKFAFDRQFADRIRATATPYLTPRERGRYQLGTSFVSCRGVRYGVVFDRTRNLYVPCRSGWATDPATRQSYRAWYALRDEHRSILFYTSVDAVAWLADCRPDGYPHASDDWYVRD